MSSMMPMDAYRKEDSFTINFDLPGVDPNSVDLTVEKNVLTVRADRNSDRGNVDELIVAERPTGSFTRQLFLGESLDTERMEANYDQGVLTITIPVAEQAKPRKVEIKGGGEGKKMIDTSAAA